ncbi:MAG: DUF4266 domain-containing protein [Burkholderiales bacterium]|nr:DUF4266 domain-containing protein [Burkholderiales bacterium]
MKSLWAKTLLLSTALLVTACTKQPWVKPYEREFLADPIMSFSRDQISDWQLQHVYETREAARGAGVVVTGGCGCN